MNGVKSITGSGESGIRELNEEELEWLNKFEGEYTNASVSQSDPERLKNQLHNTKELAKDCTDRNNQRNRCLLNITKSTNQLKFRNWAELDQNTISKLEGFDLEFALAVNSPTLLEELRKSEDDTDDSGDES